MKPILHNLIKSEFAFKLFVKQNNLGNKLQAGSYKLSPSMSLKEIANAMQNGSEDVWITLIEGWRIEEMAEKLKTKGAISCFHHWQELPALLQGQSNKKHVA